MKLGDISLAKFPIV